MEEIIIKKIEVKSTSKGDQLLLTLNGNRFAAVAPWEKEIQDFVNSVGVGGSFKGTIETKGDYTNLVEVDFNSNKSNPNYVAEQPTAKVAEPKNVSTLSEKDRSITAQTLTKCWANINQGEKLGPAAILDAYRFFHERL